MTYRVRVTGPRELGEQRSAPDAGAPALLPAEAAPTPGSGVLTVSVWGDPGQAMMQIDAAPPVAVGLRSTPDGLSVTVGGTVHQAWRAVDGERHWVFVDGIAVGFDDVPPPRRGNDTGPAGAEVRSPMPGTVIEVRVRPGQPVRTGEPLVVVEAMKMEHVLGAPHDGIAVLFVGKGDSVGVDQVVARVDQVAARVDPPEG
jgi:acetyl-CoA/propionyl-CoA carboxylase biotin carboxyl carrier protein